MTQPHGLTRRKILASGAGAAIAFPMVNMGQYAFGSAQTQYSKRSIDLVGETLVLDMLAPLHMDFSPDANTKPPSEKAIADYKRSGITGFHNAFGLGGPNAYENALAYMANWQGYAGRSPDVFALIGSMQDLEHAKATGRIGVIMGVQNADHFRKVEDVKTFYDLGQRCSQLTYNSQNRLGSGSTERVDGGLSDYGVAIMEAMASVGMLIDVSHSGDQTTLDASNLATVPIAYTHSNCRAISGHPRSKTDDAIKALGKNGGVMGVAGVRQFVSKTEPTNITHIVDHIEHIISLIGIDHVGIGSDSDLYGYDDMKPEQNKMLRAAYKGSYAFREKIDVDGFDHPLKMFDLTEELIRRNYSDENIKAVLGNNFKRLLQNTWK